MVQRSTAVTSRVAKRLPTDSLSPIVRVYRVARGRDIAADFPSIPTGLHQSAQGCEERATLGKRFKNGINPERVAAKVVNPTHTVRQIRFHTAATTGGTLLGTKPCGDVLLVCTRIFARDWGHGERMGHVQIGFNPFRVADSF